MAQSFDVHLPPDLIAGLWQEAPFARLPQDAPTSLRDQVEDIDNPFMVYAIHRASRRHGFQLLVDKFVRQLRVGCETKLCDTATCFSYRKRLAGKTPLRRYNSTSARTLAVYLASLDDPETGLCPHLKHSSETAGTGNLLFTRSPMPTLPQTTAVGTGTKSPSPKRRQSEPLPVPKTISSVSVSETPDQYKQMSWESTFKKEPERTDIKVVEQATSRDHRSFAATTFSTMAFKMLEWLTPKGVDEISTKLRDTNVEGENDRNEETVSPSRPKPQLSSAEAAAPPDSPNSNSEVPVSTSATTTSDFKSRHAPKAVKTPSSRPSRQRPSRTRKHSVAELSSSSQPPDDIRPVIKSPTLSTFHAEKLSRPRKGASAIMSPAIPEVPSKPAFFERVSSPTQVQVRKSTTTSDICTRQCSSSGQCRDKTSRMRPPVVNRKKADKVTLKTPTKEDPPGVQPGLLPQSLPKLSLETVEFMYDVFKADGTFETVFPQEAAEDSLCQMVAEGSKLRRRHHTGSPSRGMKWKTFNEQTLFRVLSDPYRLIASFVQGDNLCDSQILWHCFVRLTRVAPSVVLHSLWLAAGSLFNYSTALAVPKRPQRHELTNKEAGWLMAICLHALVALVPVVQDSQTMYDLSRIRATGSTLGGSGSTRKQPVSLCLQYDDAFSNELALRLARRLFCALIARGRLNEAASAHQGQSNGSTIDTDVLAPFLAQVDLLEVSSIQSGPETARSDRLLHKSRVPTLLLDWARAIMMREWDGQPIFSLDSAFSGAVLLMASLYEKRDSLFLGDLQFRADYFAERLDAIEMPLKWVNFTSASRSSHLLDYPFFFASENLVFFFRAINFAKMSRGYEESSSLKQRMLAIVDSGSLITNPHHKVVLQESLKTASSKYLVLEISRRNAVRDAFDQLWRREKRELLRPLKVHLGEDSGEEGFDSGGVQQEFFRLAMAECLHQDFGAFTTDERTRMSWFVPNPLVDTWKFELMGLLVSLALYNGLTLPVTFPKALYRKLLGEPVTDLRHIADGWPDLASGLTALLEWDEKDGSIEDVFARTFEFSVSTYGCEITRQMGKTNVTWPQGPMTAQTEAATESQGAQASSEDDVPYVTGDNRDEFVSEYIRYLTDVTIRPQYLAFERGFRTCLAPKSLQLLNSSTLQQLVEGVQQIDLAELRRHTRYLGWDASHPSIKHFWSIVKRYGDDMKRKLLEFVTASDRVPVGGIRNVQFVIQRNGVEEGQYARLPTAYTCYGTLLLPEYPDKDTLRERLGMALENAQGFGFA